MRHILFLLLCAAVAQSQPPATGKILVLDNERTLEGDIERVGDEYHVRRSFGTTTIPADHVLTLCNSKQDVLSFLRQRANQSDPDERLRLARWCHLQGLREEALFEIKAAVELRPNHDESKRLLAYFQQSVKTSEKKPAAPVQLQTHTGPPLVSISVEAMAEFTTHIQPILMNACAKCHSSMEHTSTFRLQRTQGLGMANRRAAQENVSAVLNQVRTQQPERSPLLVKAISAHGPSADAPIKGRQAPAYRTLEDWVQMTLASNPHLYDVLKAPAPAVETVARAPEPPRPEPGKPQPEPQPSPPAPTIPPPPPAVRVEAPVATPSSTPPEPARSVPVLTATTPAPPPPVTAAEPESEFDPIFFNRQMHPQGKPAVPAEAPDKKDRE